MPSPKPVPMDPALQTWIAVDVGGSGARVWCVQQAGDGRFQSSGPLESIEWSGGDWRPLPLADQLREAAPAPDASERAEASRRLDALAMAIHRARQELAGASIRRGVSVAAPGLRTPGGDGLMVVRHGPRVPNLVKDLGVRLDERVSLCGDSLAGGLGETSAATGGLCAVRHGLYVGGGTGLAEALVVDGVVRELGPELFQAWRLPGRDGATYEELLAPFHVNRRWFERTGGQAFIEQCRLAGDPVAQELIAELMRDLHRYIEFRADEFEAIFGEPLQRIVLGQAFANLLDDLELPPRCQLSDLRAAPAIGAVAHALRSGAFDA